MTLRGALKLGAVSMLATTMAACGPAGVIAGKVTVEGGVAGNVVVLLYGAASTATVTASDGSFGMRGLPDGQYVVRAVVKGAEVEDLSVPTTLKDGKAEGEVTLAFRFSTGKVSGTVAFSDGSDASNLAVTLTGTASRGARTTSGGAFSFEGVPPGAYLVAVEAPDTKEARVGVGVVVQTAEAKVGELRLTPVGRVNGLVTANSMPVANATVVVGGTSLAATTDALGRFTLDGVPAGDRSFVARTASPPRAATQSVAISRGQNTDLAFVLMDDSRRGTVQGAITFVGQQSPKIISLSVPGTSVTATPAANGQFVMQVPVGTWDIVASAQYHPKAVIGRVNIAEGEVTTLPAATLSFYEPLWEAPSTITALSVPSASATTWYALGVSDSFGARTLLVNHATRDVRVVAAAAVDVTFSANAKYAGFVLSGQLFTYELAQGELKAWGARRDAVVNAFAFSSDETTLFVSRTTSLATPGHFLQRIALATGLVTRFPTTGYAAQVLSHTNDRHLVWLQSTDVTLVTTTSDYPSVFAAAAQLVATPTPMALSACTATLCSTLKVLAPTATVAHTVAPTAGTFDPGVFGSATTLGGTGDSPFLLNSEARYVIIRASDGSAYRLLAGTSRPVYNQTGTQFAYVTTVSPTVALRQDVLPVPSPNPSELTRVTSPTTLSLTWLTPARLVVVDNPVAPATRHVYDIKGGLMTVDDLPTTGATAGAVELSGSSAAWASAVASKWKVIIGDKPTLALDVVPFDVPLLAVRARLWTSYAPSPDVGGLSFDDATAYIIDAQQQVKRSGAGRMGGALRWGGTDFWVAARPYRDALVTFSGDQVIDHREPSMLSLVTAVTPTESDAVMFAASGKRLFLGSPP